MAAVPPGNVRVPRAEFAAVWSAAERRCDEATRRGEDDWYAAGVAITCEWVARAVVRSSDGALFPARAPVTKGTRLAYEELIDAESLAAERLDLQRPRPWWLARRPGWTEGIGATLRWCWHRSGPPPLDVVESATP